MNQSHRLTALVSTALLGLALSGCGGDDDLDLNSSADLVPGLNGFWISECTYIPNEDLYAIDEQNIRGNNINGTVYFFATETACNGPVVDFLDYSSQITYQGQVTLGNGIIVDSFISRDSVFAQDLIYDVYIQLVNNQLIEYLDSSGSTTFVYDRIL